MDTLCNPVGYVPDHPGYVVQPQRIRPTARRPGSEPRPTTSEPLRPGSEPSRIRSGPPQIRCATPSDTSRTTPDTLYNPNGYVQRRIDPVPNPSDPVPNHPGYVMQPPQIRPEPPQIRSITPTGIFYVPFEVASKPRFRFTYGASCMAMSSVYRLNRRKKKRASLKGSPRKLVG
jgi:hypothetical protein